MLIGLWRHLTSSVCCCVVCCYCCVVCCCVVCCCVVCCCVVCCCVVCCCVICCCDVCWHIIMFQTQNILIMRGRSWLKIGTMRNGSSDINNTNIWIIRGGGVLMRISWKNYKLQVDWKVDVPRPSKMHLYFIISIIVSMLFRIKSNLSEMTILWNLKDSKYCRNEEISNKSWRIYSR